MRVVKIIAVVKKIFTNFESFSLNWTQALELEGQTIPLVQRIEK